MRNFDCPQCAASARQGQFLANLAKKLSRKGRTRTENATVVSRRVASARFPTAGSTWDYLVSFRLDNGTELELIVTEAQFHVLNEGQTGTLTWAGDTLSSFVAAEV